MVNWLYLLIGVITSVALWPVSKWGLQKEGSERALGFWNTWCITIISFIILLFEGSTLFVAPIFYSGVLTGTVYAVGFLMIIMYCLKIGPAGLTMTINNASMVVAILYSIIFLKPHIPSSLVIAGIIGVLVSITLIGLSNDGSSTAEYDYKKWFKLVIIGASFSGIAFANQAYMGYCNPGLANTMIFMFWANLASSIILLAISIYKKQSVFRKREMIAGSINGFFNLITISFTFIAIGIYGSEITFPIVICVPIVIMLFYGRIVYKEKFTTLSLTGSIIAVLSIFLLSLG